MKKIKDIIKILCGICFIIMCLHSCAQAVSYKEISYSGSVSNVLDLINDSFNFKKSGFNSSTQETNYNDMILILDSSINWGIKIRLNGSSYQLQYICGSGTINVNDSFTRKYIYMTGSGYFGYSSSYTNNTSGYVNNTFSNNYSTADGTIQYQLIKYDGKYYETTSQDFSAEDLMLPTFISNGYLLTYDNHLVFNLDVYYTLTTIDLGRIDNMNLGNNYIAKLYQLDSNYNKFSLICDSSQDREGYFNHNGIDFFGNELNISPRFLYSGYFYQLDIEYQTSGVSRVLTELYYINGREVGSGSLGLYSGDNNFSIQNQTNDIINNQNNVINDLYNSLFVMQSGDSTELYNLVASYFPSGETPISVYDTIFGSLSNEPDDFIIRWDDIPLNFTLFGGQSAYSGDFIKAGSINFSKTCRDNSVLSLIKFWLNTIIVIGFIFTFYRTLYKCICDILGVIAEDVDISAEPEHHEIGFKM